MGLRLGGLGLKLVGRSAGPGVQPLVAASSKTMRHAHLLTALLPPLCRWPVFVQNVTEAEDWGWPRLGVGCGAADGCFVVSYQQLNCATVFMGSAAGGFSAAGF